MTKCPPVSITVSTSGVSAQYFCPPHETISIRLESSHFFYLIYSFIDLRARQRGRPWPRRRCPPWSTTSSPPSSTPSRLPRVRKTDQTKRKNKPSSFFAFSNKMRLFAFFYRVIIASDMQIFSLRSAYKGSAASVLKPW